MKTLMFGLVLTLFTPVAFPHTPLQKGKPAKPSSSSARHDFAFPFTGKLVFEGRVVQGSIRRSEIDSLLARRVELGGQDSDYGKYGLGFSYEDGHFPAFSCQEWAQARKLGLDSDLNTYQRSMESFFVDTCSFLFALRDAKPPRRSFIANPKVGLSNLNLLPHNVLESLSGEGEDKIERSTARGMRISNLVARREVKVKSKTSDIVVLHYDYDPETKVYSSAINLEEMGRADFDGDGIEDIFVSSADYATQGTFRYYNYLLLTRRSPSAGFEVRKLELPALKEDPAARAPAIKLKSSELRQEPITQETYGKAWPFEVKEGVLACARAGSIAVFFKAGGKTYPLNAWARGSQIDGVTVSSNTFDVLNATNMSAIFDKAFAMCEIK